MGIRSASFCLLHEEIELEALIRMARLRHSRLNSMTCGCAGKAKTKSIIRLQMQQLHQNLLMPPPQRLPTFALFIKLYRARQLHFSRRIRCNSNGSLVARNENRVTVVTPFTEKILSHAGTNSDTTMNRNNFRRCNKKKL